MKYILIIVTLTISIALYTKTAQAQTPAVDGAWHTKSADIEQTLVFVDGLVSHTTFDITNKKFIATRGGSYTLIGNKLLVTWEYDTEKATNEVPLDQWLGQTTTFDATVNENLSSDISGETANWQRLDSNGAALAGVWYMSGRKQGDEISTRSLGDRRTYKILSGTRFQWVAINIKTGQFSGTGGGTYTFENGKYTENIEFFSRNNDRVGASLAFDGKIEDGQWHHSGLSSAGDPIYEIWSRVQE